MYIPPRLKRWLWAIPPLVLLLLPGWEATLAPMPHEQMLTRLRDGTDVFGVSRSIDGDAGEWHATYMDSTTAGGLATLNLRDLCTRVVPPDFVAYIPAGARMAEEYMVPEVETRWPWWWPGGGVDWQLPD